MARQKFFIYQVKLKDNDPQLTPTYEAMGWLSKNHYRPDRHYTFDMHAGILGYTSFFFKDEELSILFTLTFANDMYEG